MAVEPSTPPSETGLARNSLGAASVAVISVAAGAPAATIALGFPAMAGFAGRAYVLALLAAVAVVALQTNTFVEFSKRLPSAGSLLAWNTAGLGPNVGFVFGWFFVGGYFLMAATGLAAFGGYAHDFFDQHLSVDVPWWVFTGICAAYIMALAWRGVGQTLKSALALLGIEVGVITVLCVSLLVTGRVHLQSAPLHASSSPGGWSGIGLALTFGVLNVVGYEQAATFAEEARNPRRTISRGLWLAGLGLSAFYLLVGYLFVSSYGSIATFVGDPDAAQTLAHRMWGGADVIIPLVVILSSLAFGQTAFNAGVRVIYSLGRSTLLPRVFARTHPRHRSPSAAIVLFGLVCVPATFAIAAVVGPFKVYAYFGFMTAVSFLVMYALTSLALVVYILRHDRATLNPLRHIVVPLVAMGGVLYPLYREVHPLPAAPYPTLIVIVGAWVVIGVGLLIYVRASRRANVDEVAQSFAALGPD